MGYVQYKELMEPLDIVKTLKHRTTAAADTRYTWRALWMRITLQVHTRNFTIAHCKKVINLLYVSSNYVSVTKIQHSDTSNISPPSVPSSSDLPLTFIIPTSVPCSSDLSLTFTIPTTWQRSRYNDRLLPGRSVVQIVRGAKYVSSQTCTEPLGPIQSLVQCVAAGSFSGGLVAAAWSSPSTSTYRRNYERIKLYTPPFPLHDFAARDKLYLLPDLTAVFRVSFLFFSGSFPTTRRRQHGLCFLPVKHHSTFFIFCFACPTNRPGSSWFMTYVYVCGDVASRCQHELCKAADTTGMHSTNVCSPQCMGDLRPPTHGAAVGIPAVRIYTTPTFIYLGYAERFPESLRIWADILPQITPRWSSFHIPSNSLTTLSLDTIQLEAGVHKY